MLFKLSLKNIRKSIKDYTIYFFTLVLGIAVFYVFNALDSSSAMLTISNSGRQIVDLMVEIMKYISIFVSIVLGFLIIYANNFLMKRRKKEFGTYMLLGMGKQSISKILLLETLLIGTLSLVVGLVLGVIASQFMSVLVAKMFEADMSEYAFQFSNNAFIKTIVYFAIIYVFVMIFNTISVSKSKLITLLNSVKQNEQVKIKNTWISFILFIISLCILGYAYYVVTWRIDVEGMQFKDLGIAILLGCVGTFLLFYSFSGFILKVVQSNKRFYFKNLNMFVVRQINSKINTTVISMSLISIMLFFTICILSSALVVNQATTSQLKKYTPVDINISYFYDPNSDMSYYVGEDILDDLKDGGISTSEVFKDTFSFKTYYDEEVTYVETTPEYVKIMKKNGVQNLRTTKEELVKLSDYNKLAKLYHMQPLTLEENEYVVVADFDGMTQYRNVALQEHQSFMLNGKEYMPLYDTCQDGFLDITFMEMNMGFIVVPDHAITEENVKSLRFVGNYTDTFLEKEISSEEEMINNAIMEAHKDTSFAFGFSVLTKSSIYEGSVGLSAIATFVGIYLGMIFLITSAAVLALKELSESSDNKSRYEILRKIGADEKMIHHSLFIQIGIFFALPILVAILHSIFGIQFCLSLLAIFNKGDLWLSIVLTAIFIGFIYGGYFLITYLSGKSIIKE